MDFVYLVTSGKYKKENLNGNQKSFIDGMEYAMETLECAASNLFEPIDEKDGEGRSIIEKLTAEIQVDAAEQLLEWIEAERCTVIVQMNDENITNEENEKYRKERDLNESDGIKHG